MLDILITIKAGWIRLIFTKNPYSYYSSTDFLVTQKHVNVIVIIKIFVFKQIICEQ